MKIFVGNRKTIENSFNIKVLIFFLHFHGTRTKLESVAKKKVTNAPGTILTRLFWRRGLKIKSPIFSAKENKIADILFF
jgi:hypothetical protein